MFARTTQPTSGNVETSFSVEDMTCSQCVSTFENALKAGLPGTQFSIDLENHRVTVAGDARAAEKVIRDAGYEPRLLDGTQS